MRGVRVDPERREIRLLRRHVPIDNARVLEIGCGDGRLSRRLAGPAGSVISMDLTHGEVTVAQRMMPERHRAVTRFTVASCEHLPFPDGYFDVVLFSWSL